LSSQSTPLLREETRKSNDKGLGFGQLISQFRKQKAAFNFYRIGLNVKLTKTIFPEDVPAPATRHHKSTMTASSSSWWWYCRRFLTSIVLTLLCVGCVRGLLLVEGYGNASRRRKGSPPLARLLPPSRSRLLADLQRCATPRQVIERVGRHVTPAITESDSHGLNSLVWIRLCKLLVQADNAVNDKSDGRRGEDLLLRRTLLSDDDHSAASLTDTASVLTALTEQLLLSSPLGGSEEAAATSLSFVVEITKAAAVVSRILLGKSSESDDGISALPFREIFGPIAAYWEKCDAALSTKSLPSLLSPPQLSGLHWSYNTFRVSCAEDEDFSGLPPCLKKAYADLDLPFEILPSHVDLEDLTVPNLMKEVDLRVDDIRTDSDRVVPERRQTAWQGDEGVEGFAYSGKTMPRNNWSPAVKSVRDQLRPLHYYDGCLINLYADGESGMRYHVDPDQGSLWDYETTVVSCGATRRFAFRPIAPGQGDGDRKRHRQQPNQVHSFYVMHGDATHMFGDCQVRFQHTVKKAESKAETAPRASLVFKRTYSGAGN